MAVDLAVKKYLLDIWRNRWLVVGVAWAVSVVFAVVIALKPDRYEATARIYIDTQSVLKPLMAGLAFQPDIDQQVRMLARTLLSRPTVSRLRAADDLGWDNKSSVNFERDVDDLMKSINVSSVGSGANIYSITYRDSNPQRAARLVARLVEIFVKSGSSDKRKDSEEARKFIDESIRTNEAKLAAAENALKDYKLKNFGVTGVPAQDYFVRMSTLSDEVSRLTLELNGAEQSRDALKRELASEEPQLPPDASPGPMAVAPSELDTRYDAAKRQLDELLRRFTEQHPDVVSTRRVIAQIEAERAREREARARAAAASGKSPAATSPVYQRIRIALAEAEANVASTRVRLNAQRARLEEIRALASRAPQAEAELSQLNRDYEVIRKNYEQLVARRESASLGVRIDESSPLAEFRIIDPPRTTPRPVLPNRLSLALLGAVAAFAAGLSVPALRSRIWPVVDSMAKLAEVSKRPVIAVVSMQPAKTSLARRRTSAIGFATACLGLFLIHVVTVGWFASRTFS